jgi:glycine cleavage system H protein
VATVESVKATSDVFSPVEGKVVEVNEALNDNPGLVNESPEENGWFVRLEVDSPNLDQTMSAEDYAKHVESAAH